jgi:hypothetical protein
VSDKERAPALLGFDSRNEQPPIWFELTFGNLDKGRMLNYWAAALLLTTMGCATKQAPVVSPKPAQQTRTPMKAAVVRKSASDWIAGDININQLETVGFLPGKASERIVRERLGKEMWYGVWTWRTMGNDNHNVFVRPEDFARAKALIANDPVLRAALTP